MKKWKDLRPAKKRSIISSFLFMLVILAWVLYMKFGDTYPIPTILFTIIAYIASRRYDRCPRCKKQLRQCLCEYKFTPRD